MVENEERVNKRSIKEWCKEHEALLITAGVIAAAAAGTYLIFHYTGVKPEHIPSCLKKLQNNTKPPASSMCSVVESVWEIDELVSSVPTVFTTVGKKPVTVAMHTRKLPVGQSASPEKVAEAITQDIMLPSGYTWVISYVRNAA